MELSKTQKTVGLVILAAVVLYVAFGKKMMMKDKDDKKAAAVDPMEGKYMYEPNGSVYVFKGGSRYALTTPQWVALGDNRESLLVPFDAVVLAKYENKGILQA